MPYQIIFHDNVVAIILNDREFTKNEISEYVATRDLEHLENCCDLFIHFSESEIKVEENLYFELATLINNEMPENNIDWLNTFTAIQKENYAEVLRRENNDESESNVFDDIEGAIDYNEEIQDEMSKYNFRESLKEGVRIKLEERGII